MPMLGSDCVSTRPATFSIAFNALITKKKSAKKLLTLGENA
jgi:hypothetical protein